jgi:hypothetical protein
MNDPIRLTNNIPSAETSIGRSPLRRGLALLTTLALTLGSLALSPQARATCIQGCNLGQQNTFLGDDALINNTTGTGNTAIGANALANNTTGFENAAYGLGDAVRLKASEKACDHGRRADRVTAGAAPRNGEDARPESSPASVST